MDFKKVKKMLLGEEARVKLKEGIDLVANYTKITLGPKGHNVALNQIGPLPTRVVNDGVTIAKEVRSEDPFVQSGVEMCQEICEKTNQNAGDGTTQTALLAQAIIAEGQKKVSQGDNPMDVKREIEEDLSQLTDVLVGMSHKVESIEDIRHLATISGNNDETIGNSIAEVMEKVGMNASIIIERGSEDAIRTETVKGMYFDKGYRAPAFINTFDKGIAEYKEPNIFIVNEDLRYDDDLTEFFVKCDQQKINNIVVIANEIDGEAFQSLCLTHKAQYDQKELGVNLSILAIEAPYYGPNREDFMNDLAIYIGGKVIKKLRECDPQSVKGSCERIVSNSKTTTIIGGKGDQKEIQLKIDEIKNLISQLDSAEKTTKENLEKRRDTLESGVGIIYGGGKTEIEIRDRYLRLEDAVRASKAAVKEGFVAGGGYSYLLLSELAKTSILSVALQSVIKQVAINAGKAPEMILQSCKDKQLGYNAKTDAYEDLVATGVIDATLVLKNALQNAVSLAGLFLTTDALICEFEEARQFKF